MNRDVIQYCIDKLTSLQEELDKTDKLDQFDMGYWANSIVSHDAQVVERDCGFAGCFVGWAIHQKWFEPFGWRAEFEQGASAQDVFPWFYEPGRGEKLSVSEGLRQLFGLENYSTDDYIILPSGYVGSKIEPIDVAKRLQQLLDHGEDYFLELMGHEGEED